MKKVITLVLTMAITVSLFAEGSQETAQAGREAYYEAAVYKTVTNLLIESDSPRHGGTLRLPMATSPQSFNFYGTLDNAAYEVLYNMLDTLVEYNPVTNEIEPGLAESWEVSEDGKKVVFHLRPVEWSDGESFSADDVVFTFNELVLNKFAEGNSLTRYTLNGEVIRFQKLDDLTVEAILPVPYGAFFSVLTAAVIYPEHVVADKIDHDDPGSVNNLWTTDADPSMFVGTGPYMLTQYVVDQKVSLVANPRSWKADAQGNVLPYFDALEYLILPNAETHAVKLAAGEIDYIAGMTTKVSPADYPFLKQAELDGKGVKVYAAQPVNPTPSPLHIGFNFDSKDPELSELFQTHEFRIAMEHALDRDRVIEEVYNSLAVYGGVPVLPANTAFYNPEIESIRRDYDPAQAEKILDSLKLTDRNGDGWRDFPSGKTLEFVLTTANTPDQQDAAFLYSESLKSLGVKCELQILDPSLRAQKVLGGDFDASLWAFGNQPDPQLRKAIWQPGNALYYVHLSAMDPDTKSPIVSELNEWEKAVYDAFEAGQSAMDPEKRKESYDQWQQIYAEYLPFIYIAKGMDLVAAQESLGNFFQLDNGAMAFTPYTVFRK